MIKSCVGVGFGAANDGGFEMRVFGGFGEKMEKKNEFERIFRGGGRGLDGW